MASTSQSNTETQVPCHATVASSSTSQSNAKRSVHDFTVKDARGNDVNLVGEYRGRVLLIVNVASESGSAESNYTELNELYMKLRDYGGAFKGLEILAFPCNQFGAKETGTKERIVELACTRFKADFPIFGKLEIFEKHCNVHGNGQIAL